jgi:glutathione S-transferase
MATHSNGTNGSAEHPEIILYTNHGCPWAHRSHIALKELGLPFEEVIIDLDRPRDPWYLEINPRGLVPSIKYNGEIITESGTVSNFLADAYPSRLVPPSQPVSNALKRARINWFVDTYISKVSAFALLRATGEEATQKADAIVKTVTTELAPLLKDAAPFFGGSDHITLVEVQLASHVIRLRAVAKAGFTPKGFAERLEAIPEWKKWADAIETQDSVTYIWDEEKYVNKLKARLEKLRAGGGK